MASRLVQARIDGEGKQETTTVAAAMGLTVSDAIRRLHTRAFREQAPAWMER